MQGTCQLDKTPNTSHIPHGIAFANPEIAI